MHQHTNFRNALDNLYYISHLTTINITGHSSAAHAKATQTRLRCT